MFKLKEIFKRNSIFILNKSCSNITKNTQTIDISPYIKRNPCDLLRALEGTIVKDPTAVHYKYHDDPYLIPMSNMSKRTFAMAQEAGRKAAHWVRQQHPELFNHSQCDPPVQHFFPQTIYREENSNNDVSEIDLVRLIKNVQVNDAKFVYKLLRERSINVSKDVTQSLLELICFQNGEDAISSEFVEERWFRQSNKIKERTRKTWKDGEFAEELFIQIENPETEAYGALIQGMTRYYQVNRAFELFEEAKQKNHKLNTETYNSIIGVCSFIKEDYEMRWTLVMELLTEMESFKVPVNIGTLNAILQTLTTMGSRKQTKDYALSTLAEFKKIGIEPCLGSWYLILSIFCKERGPSSTILHDIMDQIQDKEHSIQDLKDTYFFVSAMDVCRNYLNNAELGGKVHKLLTFANNYNLIGDSYKESVYYRHFFALLCNNIPLDTFMSDIYNGLVPNTYVPEPGVMTEVLKQVELNGAVQHLPRLWSDMVIFDHTNRENLIEIVVNIMVENERETIKFNLNQQFSEISWDLFNRLINQKEYINTKITITGEMLGKIMTILLRNNDFTRASEIFIKLENEQQFVVGVPKFKALDLYFQQCLKERLPSLAIKCIQYCNEAGFQETNKLVDELKKNLTLDETHFEELKKSTN